MLSFTPPMRTAVFLARIVMPFSRSRSIESMTRSATSWFARNEPCCQSIASTSVVLPWSTCATIATLRRSSRRVVVAERGMAESQRSRRSPRYGLPMPFRRDAAAAFVVAGLIAAALLWLGPPGSDTAAHVYQRWLLMRHGFASWDNYWYS